MDKLVKKSVNRETMEFNSKMKTFSDEAVPSPGQVAMMALLDPNFPEDHPDEIIPPVDVSIIL